MKNLCGGSSFVEDWSNVMVQLYIDPSAKLKGEVVGGVRIHTDRPITRKSELLPSMNTAWNNAIAAYDRDGNLNKVLDRMVISKENQQLIIDRVNQNVS